MAGPEDETAASRGHLQPIMGDVDDPWRLDRNDAAAAELPGLPAMPDIGPDEQIEAVPYPLVDGISPTIGWQFRPRRNGGPAFMIIRRSGLGWFKVVESFPLTEDGWGSAWRSLTTRNPAATRQVLVALRSRQTGRARRRAPEAITPPASRADREQVIGTLKNAFVAGMLAKDEFDLRVGQALASWTYPELAALTADLPAAVAAATPGQLARERCFKAIMAGYALFAGLLLTAVLFNHAGTGNGAGTALLLLGAFLLGLILIPAQIAVIASQQQKPARGQLPPRLGPSATGQASPRPPLADSAGHLPRIDSGHPDTAEAARHRDPHPQLPSSRPPHLRRLSGPRYSFLTD